MHSSRMHTTHLPIVLGGGRCCDLVLGGCCDLVLGGGVVTRSQGGKEGVVAWSWGRGCCDLVPGGRGRCCGLVLGECCDLVPGGGVVAWSWGEGVL